MTLSVRKSRSVSLFLLLLFQIFVVESLTACEPITNSCCCQEGVKSPFACSSSEEKASSCCSFHEVEIGQSQESSSCHCLVDGGHHFFMAPTETEIPEVQYLVAFTIPSALELQELSLVKQWGITEDTRCEVSLRHFTQAQWPTICFRC